MENENLIWIGLKYENKMKNSALCCSYTIAKKDDHMSYSINVNWRVIRQLMADCVFVCFLTRILGNYQNYFLLLF